MIQDGLTCLEGKEDFSDKDCELIRRLSRRIVRLRLSPVALLFIESVRPLNYVGSQLLHFLSPIVHAFGDFSDHERLARILENRRSIDLILETIEKEEENYAKKK